MPEKRARVLIDIFNKNQNNHIPSQDWFAACGGIYNTFEGAELGEITACLVEYRLASCHKSQSASELRREIEVNYRKSHANIGATVAAFKNNGFDVTPSEEKALRSLDPNCTDYTAQKSKTFTEQYAEQVTILNNLEFSEVKEDLHFHHETIPSDNFYLREKLLNKVSSTVFFDSYRLRVPLQPLTSFCDLSFIDGRGDLGDKIVSFQTISVRGKTFEKGYTAKGAAHFIPSKEAVLDSSEVIICEGYATGESIYQGSSIPVVCAMSKANMLLAAVSLTENRTFELTIAADNDAVDDCRKIIGIVNTQRGCDCKFAGIITPDNDIRNGDFSDDWVAAGGVL